MTVGWGEASPLESYSPDTLDEAESDLREWAAAWEGGSGDPGSLGCVPAARCAIDTALLDLTARQQSVPLRALLAEVLVPRQAVESVPVCALARLPGLDRPGAGPETDDVIAEVDRRVSEGFAAIKFKVGSDAVFQEQLLLLTRVRERHPDLLIRLDANGCWSEEEAQRHLAELGASVRPEFVEQPVSVAELSTFRDAPAPIAADESLRIADSLDALLAPGGCQAIVLKPMILGGLRTCATLAAEAHAQEALAVVSHAFGGPVSHAAACELALAIASAAPSGDLPAAGLAGHGGLAQMAGSRIVPAAVSGHGMEGPA